MAFIKLRLHYWIYYITEYIKSLSLSVITEYILNILELLNLVNITELSVNITT